MLELKETIEQLTTANEVRCYGHVLRDDNSILRVALDLEVTREDKDDQQRPERSRWRRSRRLLWKNQPKWRNRVRAIAEEMG